MDDDRELQAWLAKTKPYFWLAPDGFHEQAPLTAAMVEACENALGLRLPAAYVAVLKLQNGGRPRYDHHSRPRTHAGEKAVEMEQLFGIGPRLPGHAETFEEGIEYLSEWGIPDGVFPVSFHGGLGGVALDYREVGRRGEPAVVYADTCDREVVALSRDFSSFVEGLFVGDRDHAYGLVYVGADPTELLRALEAALPAQFTRYDPPPVPAPDRRDDLFFRASHSEWRSWLGRFSADLELVRNRHGRTGYLAHPAHPECDWILKASLHPQHRPALERCLALVPFRKVPLHLPPWERLGSDL